MHPAISRFADAMEEERAKHEEENGGDTWLDQRPLVLCSRLEQQAAQLRALIARRDRDDDAEIKKRTAHVANFAMMVSDQVSLGRRWDA